MSCGTNRCGLRRFDGHGTSSYRPTNPEVAKAFNSSIQAMIAERSRQDSGIFSAPITVPSIPEPLQSKPIIPQSSPSNQSANQSYYSLSDSNMKS
jgi:hypothetical protein